MILTVDQGTTSTRALLVDSTGRIKASAQRALPQRRANQWEANPIRTLYTNLF